METTLDLTKVQQGKLLNTRQTEHMSDATKKEYNKAESIRMFKNFTSQDEGRSREFIATFNDPESCKAFVDNYNAMIDYIYELEKRYDDFANMF